MSTHAPIYIISQIILALWLHGFYDLRRINVSMRLLASYLDVLHDVKFLAHDCLVLTKKIHFRYRLKWIKERVSLYFRGGGLISNIFKLSLLNLYSMKYLKEAFHFWFQELCSLVTWLATPNCLYKFKTKFTIVCSCNTWLILFSGNGYNHQV